MVVSHPHSEEAHVHEIDCRGGRGGTPGAHRTMEVVVVPHDPRWPAAFEAEADRLRAALGGLVVAIDHMGSTAIAGIHAKPIIDMLLSTPDAASLDGLIPVMVRLGYQSMGEFGIPGRRYFRKESPEGRRTHHAHAFAQGSPSIERHLAFRDYMNAHPAAAQRYGLLKQALAASHPDDIEAYMDGKDAFVKAQEARALAWAARVRRRA